MNILTREELDIFHRSTNFGTYGHPDDIERFENFIISAYNNEDVNISKEEFTIILQENCNRNDIISTLYERYSDGISLLIKYSNAK